MISEYDPANQQRIEPTKLVGSRSRALIQAIAVIEFVELVECRGSSNFEFIEIAVQPEVPSRPLNDIRFKEPLVIVVDVEDRWLPETLALRSDFPSVPHLNLRNFSFPKSLCLTEEAPAFQRLGWTAGAFLRRIHDWLGRAADGSLHDIEQALEPLISGSYGTLILPSRLRSDDAEVAVQVSSTPTQDIYQAFEFDSDRPDANRYLVTVTAPPSVHGVIHRIPHTLQQLAQLCDGGDFNLVAELGDRVAALAPAVTSTSIVFLLLRLPKQRDEDGEVESTESRAFFIENEMGELVQMLGRGQWVQGHGYGAVLSNTMGVSPQNINLILLNPIFRLNREQARILSGRSRSALPVATIIGCGALGSSLVDNLIRSGAFSRAQLVDVDYLLPHNLIRHEATGGLLGQSKARFLSEALQNVVDNGVELNGVVADVMVAPMAEWLLDGTEVILDLSASVPVARMLAADLPSSIRLVSGFLSPSGWDGVLLVEDEGRAVALDELEMEYYLLVANHDLDGHLNDGSMVRYGHACRDLSAAIAKTQLALHGAIMANQLEFCLRETSAMATVWRAFPNGGVQRYDSEISPWRRVTIGEWDVRLRIDSIEKAMIQRGAALPSETGGVLVGSHDLERRILYIVDVLPAPPDSVGRPHMFERGNDGLVETFTHLGIKTAGWLKYVGEWHSHPNGASVEPSDTDWKQFKWLSNYLAKDGLPTVLMIAGEHRRISVLVDGVIQQISVDFE